MLILLLSSWGMMANNNNNNSRQQEAGISFRDIHSFGLIYKSGTNSSLWRFSAFSSYGGVTWYQHLDNHATYNFTIQAAAGKEFRKLLTENIEARYGLDLTMGLEYYHQLQGDRDPFIRTEYIPGINLVVGMNYIINNRLVIGAELLPYIFYLSDSYNSENSNYKNFTGFVYGLSNTLTFSAAYRF